MASLAKHRDPRPESVAFAAQEVLDAGERIAFDWLELLRAEWTERARSAALAFAMTAVGAGLIALAWVLASAALVVGLERRVSLEASLATVAAAHFALGGALLFFRRRRKVER